MSGGGTPAGPARGEVGGHPRDDVAAYALGALGERDASVVEDHLQACAECRAYLRWLRPAVDSIPAAVEQRRAPASLHRSLLATVRAEAAESERASAPVADRGRVGRALASRLGFAWRPVTAVALACVLVAGAVAGYVLSDSQPSRSVVAVEATPMAPPGTGGSLTRDESGATLHVEGLPPLGRDSVYQVWVQHGSRYRPSTTFVLDRHGAADAVVDRPLADADAVLVTREPRPGSRTPTTKPMLRAELG